MQGTVSLYRVAIQPLRKSIIKKHLTGVNQGQDEILKCVKRFHD